MYLFIIVYVLIFTFAQARIQTQESQIIECEAALKTRNEELKSLRSDNSDLIEKCETLDLSLQASIENALDLKGQLSTSEVFYFKMNFASHCGHIFLLFLVINFNRMMITLHMESHYHCIDCGVNVH